MEYTIDAKDKKLGRVASEAASVLMGKNRTDFAKNQVTDVKVVISNAASLDISEKKKGEKVYRRHSQYPGGLKEETLAKVLENKGVGEVVRKAVYGMLPTNKLRARMIKNLVVTE